MVETIMLVTFLGGISGGIAAYALLSYLLAHAQDPLEEKVVFTLLGIVIGLMLGLLTATSGPDWLQWLMPLIGSAGTVIVLLGLNIAGKICWNAFANLIGRHTDS